MRIVCNAGARIARVAALAALALFIAACAGTRGGAGGSAGGGGYYMDDGPGGAEPADVAAIADAVPRDEPIRASNSRPYEVFGQRYVPMRARSPYRQTGIASWYGRKFHGNATASGEPYDMYAMTAAHRTLPLPSYARVTNLSNQRSVVVRVNDRGPFVKNRLIDLSWTAAKKLGFIEHGHTRVLVELIQPGEGPEAGDLVAASAATPAPAPAPAALPAAPAVSPAAPTAAVASATMRAAANAVAPVASSSADDPPRVPSGFVLVDSAQPPPPSVVAPSAAPSSGFVRIDSGAPPAPTHYLQLGAFESRDGAMAAMSDLGKRLEWLGDALSIHPENGQFKIHAGPWADAVQARQAADRIRAEARIEPFSVRRETGR